MRPEKQTIVEEIKREVSEADYVIMADYLGLSAGALDELRTSLLELDAGFHVVKNRLLSRVESDLGVVGCGEHKGPTAIVTGCGDMSEVAKLLKRFAKGHEYPSIKGGRMGGQCLSGDEVGQMADLPPREVLLSMVVGTVAAPMTRLTGVLQQKLASLVYVLNAIERKKGGDE